MQTFQSYETELRALFPLIIQSDTFHAKWLNTLSYLENCGAKKIAACQHPTLVREEVLKHSAEEFRHAHHLKKQIRRISNYPLKDYSIENLLGGSSSIHFLNYLDLKTSQYLSKIAGIKENALKECAYLLVTYAIEKRADELYRIYDELLRNFKSKVGVKCILLEEQDHLNEMLEGIHRLPDGVFFANQICSIESKLSWHWLNCVKKELAALMTSQGNEILTFSQPH